VYERAWWSESESLSLSIRSPGQCTTALWYDWCGKWLKRRLGQRLIFSRSPPPCFFARRCRAQNRKRAENRSKNHASCIVNWSALRRKAQILPKTGAKCDRSRETAMVRPRLGTPTLRDAGRLPQCRSRRPSRPVKDAAASQKRHRAARSPLEKLRENAVSRALAGHSVPAWAKISRAMRGLTAPRSVRVGACVTLLRLYRGTIKKLVGRIVDIHTTNVIGRRKAFSMITIATSQGTCHAAPVYHCASAP
jgi:hypothetical protein